MNGGGGVYFYVFAEINVFCILILLLILFKVKISNDQQTTNLAFQKTLRSLIALLALNALWSLVEGRPSSAMRSCNYAFNVAYLILTGVVSYYWLQFTEGKLGMRYTQNLVVRFILCLPMFFLVVMTISSIWTGWFFYLDGNNNYHRGPYHFVQSILSYVYMVLSIVDVIRGYRSARTYEQKAQVRMLASFFALPVTGGLFNVFLQGVPLIWPFSSLSLLLVFLNFQEYAISTDGLTGLNNRRQFDCRLQSLVTETHRTETAFLALVDIDHFKQINDTYGHYEGDLALQETAALLKKAVGYSNLFLARYGGDEFAVLGYAGGEETAREAAETICRLCSERNAAADTPYDITMSVGYAAFLPGEEKTAPDLIAEADRMLYSEKALRRGGRLRIN